MGWTRVLLLLLAGALFGGCGGGGSTGNSGQEAVLTAATLGEQEVLGIADYLAQDRYAQADAEEGKAQAQICRACHTLEAGGVHTIGPNLHGMFGRRAGAVDGFAYSQVLGGADFVWTPRALDAWLAQPGRFLPGNLMSFPGVADAADRDALVAYLLVATSSGEGS
jgi:cytochrome c